MWVRIKALPAESLLYRTLRPLIEAEEADSAARQQVQDIDDALALVKRPQSGRSEP